MLTAYPRRRGTTSSGVCSTIGRVQGANTPNAGYGLGYGLAYGGDPFDPMTLVGTGPGEIDILYDFTALGLPDAADVAGVPNQGGFGADRDLVSTAGFVKYNAADPCVTTLGVTGYPFLDALGQMDLLDHRTYVLVRTPNNADRAVLGKSPFGFPKLRVSGSNPTRLITASGTASAATIGLHKWSLIEVDATATTMAVAVDGVFGNEVSGLFTPHDLTMDRFFAAGNGSDYWAGGSIAYFATIRHGGDLSMYDSMRQYVAAIKGVPLP